MLNNDQFAWKGREIFTKVDMDRVHTSKLRKVLGTVWLYKSTIILIMTPIILAAVIPPIYLINEEYRHKWLEGKCLIMMLLMAVYWCTEATHLSVTSLIPLLLSPLFGIMKADDTAKSYFPNINVLFLGGLIVAAAIEHSQLHRRIAVNILKLVGPNPRLLMLGFMVPSWLLSMWITNTATTAMMLAIVQAVIHQLESGLTDLEDFEDNTVNYSKSTETQLTVLKSDSEDNETVPGKGEWVENGQLASGSSIGKLETKDSQVNMIDGNKWRSTSKALSLSVCYASTVGGIATLTGTPPNLVLARNIELFSQNLNDYDFGLNFATWMGFALPVSFIVVLLCWFWLQIVFIGFRGNKQSDEERELVRAVITREYNSLGPIKFKEVITLVHFILLALLWLTRNLGGQGGWGSLFEKGYASDATAAMLISILLFLYPSELPDYSRVCGKRTEGEKPGPRAPLITWEVIVHKVPWGLILLLGGGFALADAIQTSGLSKTIGESLNFFDGWPMWATIMCISAITAAVTEVTSNTAISTIFLPIVGNIALRLGKSPLYLQLPVCIASSFAFMLPVATPPNALVFATGVLTIKDMAKTGFVLNIIGVLAATMATVLWGESMFNLDAFPYTNGTAINITSSSTQH